MKKKPDTSLSAYRSLQPDDLLATYKGIVLALEALGEGTFEDIAAYNKWSRDRVWKRLSELHRAEIIYRPGNKRVLKSGRKGYTWMLTDKHKLTKARGSTRTRLMATSKPTSSAIQLQMIWNEITG